MDALSTPCLLAPAALCTEICVNDVTNELFLEVTFETRQTTGFSVGDMCCRFPARGFHVLLRNFYLLLCMTYQKNILLLSSFSNPENYDDVNFWSHDGYVTSFVCLRLFRGERKERDEYS